MSAADPPAWASTEQQLQALDAELGYTCDQRAQAHVRLIRRQPWWSRLRRRWHWDRNGRWHSYWNGQRQRGGR